MSDKSPYRTPTQFLTTPVTKMFGIKHPILLAGMNVAAGPELAAAVTNAGGLGVIGGFGYTADLLREQISTLKSFLKNPNGPFGVDLLLPQVGGSARKTNYDYTDGKLPGLIDIIIQEKATLFVSAVGVPPKWVVEKLHAAGIAVMNMIGAPKHLARALEVGVDLVCPQGGEGGGHTGEIATSILIPKVVDMVKGHKSPLTGGPVLVIAAGGIFDGRGLAMALSFGASAVWVGTRFVCAKEAGAPPRHQQAIVKADYHDTIRTIIFTGRPMRVLKTDYIVKWEEKQDEIRKLASAGIIPAKKDMEERLARADEITPEEMAAGLPLLMGQAAGAITDILPAQDIVHEFVNDAIDSLKQASSFISGSPSGKSKL